MMIDKLSLLDSSVPLQKRYDSFLMWANDNNCITPEPMAAELGIAVSEVDIYLMLGALEEEEFTIIDKAGFDTDHLFIIVRENRREARNKIYVAAQEILKSSQPLSRIKEILDGSSHYNYVEDGVKKISAGCWFTIASYLKQRNIENGTITKKFRSMLVTAGKMINTGQQLSDKMMNWIIGAINHDLDNNLGIFTNDDIKTKHGNDFEILNDIRENIDYYVKNE